MTDSATSFPVIAIDRTFALGATSGPNVTMVVSNTGAPVTAASSIGVEHIGWAVAPLTGGEAVLSTSLTRGSVTSRLGYETTITTPALNFNVTVLVSNATAAVLLLATNQSVSDGWRFCDVGKTAYINGGAFLVQSYLNSTAVSTAIITTLPSESVSAPSGCWRVIDMRGTRERYVNTSVTRFST
jgi:hypothetical protein